MRVSRLVGALVRCDGATAIRVPIMPRGVPVPGLRAARIRTLLTQAQLGRRAALAPATIVRLEKGQRPAQLAAVAKLAAALGVEPGELTTPPYRPGSG